MMLPADHPFETDEEWQAASSELWRVFNGMIPKVEFMLDYERYDECMDILSVREQLNEPEQRLLAAFPKNRKTGRPSAQCMGIAGYFWDIQTIAAVFGKDWRRSIRTKMKKAEDHNQSLAFYMADLNRPNATLDQKPTILQSF